MMRAAPTAGLGLVVSVAALTSLACSTSSDKPPLPDVETFMADMKSHPSCVLDCDPACKETSERWTCPALADWASVPHAATCGDIATPKVVKGACAATDPAGEALAKTSFAANVVVLPDGRRIAPSGTEWLFDEKDFGGGFPASAMFVPGTKWLIVDDNGFGVHALRVIDTTVLRAGGASPVASMLRYSPPSGLSYGLAMSTTSGVVYASAGPDVKIQAYDLDKSTGTLAANAAKSVPLPAESYASGIDVSPDGKTLLVADAKSRNVLAFSLEDATYGQSKGSIDVGAQDVFAVRFDPNDPASNTAYATLWIGGVDPAKPDTMRLAQIHVAEKTATTIAVGKSPEEIVFLDARYAVVANALSDTLSIVDRPASKVTAEVKIGDVHGAGPTALAYDPPRKRLYATLSADNGVAAFDVDLSGGAPQIVPAGTISSAWWPTGVAVDPADGAVYVTNGKGHGTGTDGKQQTFNSGRIADLMMGSVQAVPFMDASALAAATEAHKAQTEVAKIAGYPAVECGGAPYDFPLPMRPEDGPSTKIKHVFFVVRENKTFDAIMGDVPGVEGDAALVMAPGHMDEIWGNARRIAGQFAQMDNYYSDAEQSIQGHAWTVFGRTTDYTERRWLFIWGRHTMSATASPGVGDDTTPQEGNVFSVLKNAGVTVDNMGDLYGLGYRDTQWPGGSSSATVPDTLGACYLSARLRASCDTKDFTYVWLANDHGFGLAAGKPNPAIMIATNDEATGMLLDGISHSPIWKESLFVVVEDDPQDGGDHVDLHRSIALFASPWIKRKYVSRAHYDIASVHKIFAHVFGKPYWNSEIADAPLPLDLFTSTPDYTPYTYAKRAYADNSCNPQGTAAAQAASRWDFTEPDDQPGLSQQNWEALHALSQGERPAR